MEIVYCRKGAAVRENVQDKNQAVEERNQITSRFFRQVRAGPLHNAPICPLATKDLRLPYPEGLGYCTVGFTLQTESEPT